MNTSSLYLPAMGNGKLVGGLEHFLFSHILGIILPIDELIFFKMVIAPPIVKLELFGPT